MFVRLVLALGAASWFVAGSMFMKPAAGFTRLWPSVAVFACFAAGLVFDVVVVRVVGEVGATAVLIIGLEVVLAASFASWLYGERLSGTRMVAMALVLLGVLLLVIDASDTPSTIEPLAQRGAAGDAELHVDALEVGVDRAT